ncbi:MAG: hypothetical protein HC827_21335 [Cyanobacteria bacterium RM1_2_2]|nr:hypothetical protein [Cyanobacteria bacterium RM1_2_2]
MPIPDVWMVLLAAVAGKLIALGLQHQPPKRLTGVLLLTGSTLAYILFSLQLYLSTLAILLPILSPIAMLWFYVLPALLRRK